MTRITRHLVIHGRVQGVFFRESMRIRAGQLNVNGWARNQADGTVEAVIQGSDASVSALLDWVRTGPPLAKVTRIEIDDDAANAAFSAFEHFEIRPSGS